MSFLIGGLHWPVHSLQHILLILLLKILDLFHMFIDLFFNRFLSLFLALRFRLLWNPPWLSWQTPWISQFFSDLSKLLLLLCLMLQKVTQLLEDLSLVDALDLGLLHDLFVKWFDPAPLGTGTHGGHIWAILFPAQSRDIIALFPNEGRSRPFLWTSHRGGLLELLNTLPGVGCRLDWYWHLLLTNWRLTVRVWRHVKGWKLVFAVIFRLDIVDVYPFKFIILLIFAMIRFFCFVNLDWLYLFFDHIIKILARLWSQDWFSHRNSAGIWMLDFFLGTLREIIPTGKILEIFDWIYPLGWWWVYTCVKVGNCWHIIKRL
jgi:hypothetical protein